MTTTIFEREESNRTTVVLYKTGAFWRAYQRSAYFVNREFKRYAIVHKRLKIRGSRVDLVYVRIPDRVLEEFLTRAVGCGFVLAERAEDRIELRGFRGVHGYEAWLHLAAHSHKVLTEFESLKEILFELERASVVVKGGRIRFNRMRSLTAYRKFLGEKSMQVVSESLKWEERYSPVLLNKRLSVLLYAAKSCYRVESEGRIEHKHLHIVLEREQVGLEDLPESERQQIGDFVTLQYVTLCKLCDILKDKIEELSSFPFEWAGSQIELIELVWLLYRTKCIVPREPDGSLQLLVDLSFRLLHQRPPMYVHQQIHKMMERHKCYKFIDRLRVEGERVRFMQEA